MRLVKKFPESSRVDIVYYAEYIVRVYYADGKRAPSADYYTDDLDDAVGTAHIMIHAFADQAARQRNTK